MCKMSYRGFPPPTRTSRSMGKKYLTSLGNTLLCFLFLLLYVLATSKVIPEWIPICNSAHSWWLYGAAPQGNQAISTQSYYPDTEPTSCCPILMRPNACPGSDRYEFIWGHWIDSIRIRTSEVRIPQSSKTGDTCSTNSFLRSRLVSLLCRLACIKVIINDFYNQPIDTLMHGKG